MAPLALFNEGGTRQFFNIMAPLTLFNVGVPTMRLPNIKKCCSAGPQECIFMAPLADTRPFSNMWYFCEVNFCVTILWYFCEVLLVVGRFDMVSLAYDNGMGPR